jgi:hypothetical protein
MKLDWDCVRQILGVIEAQPGVTCQLHPREVTGWDEVTVSGHMRLLEQHGLIEARCVDMQDGTVFCVALGLTWEGHELVAKLNSPALWARVRKIAGQKGLELSLDVVKAIAAVVIEQMARRS